MLLAKVTRLPRPVKILILLCIDALIASAAYWLASIARFGRIPSLTVEQAVLGTAAAAVLVPILALGFGFYRSMTRYLTPHLPARAGVVSAASGTLLGLLGWFGGARPLQAAAFGLVFALVVFAMLVWSRHAASWLVGAARVGGGTPVATYGAAGCQLLTMLRHAHELRPVLFIDDDAS